MKIQNFQGIYVYYTLNKEVKYYYFLNWEGFFKYFGGFYFSKIKDNFRNWEDIWRTHPNSGLFNYYWGVTSTSNIYYSAYDENGNWYPKEYINYQYSLYVKACKKANKKYGTRSKRAYGHHYNIKTFTTRRDFQKDVDVEELEINVKYRSKALPPDNWDREKYSHNDKCWKTQSKRKHQWK